MPWVRFDDHFAIHRKVAGLSDAAFRLHVSAIFWCALNLTDGWVPEEDLDDVSARVRTPARFAAECVKRGAWHEARHDCGSDKCAAPVDADGWVIHDYLEYQPSKEQVAEDRRKAAERQANWRAKKAGNGGKPDTESHAVNNSVSNGVTNGQNGYPQPSMSGNDTIHNGRSNGVTNAVSASSPPRPAPKEAGRAEPAPGRPSGRANPPGPPSGRSPANQSAAEALARRDGETARPAPPDRALGHIAAARQALKSKGRAQS